MVAPNHDIPPQQARPSKLANIPVPFESPPFDYSKPRACTDAAFAVLCILGFVAFFGCGGALVDNAQISIRDPHFIGMKARENNQHAIDYVTNKYSTGVADQYIKCVNSLAKGDNKIATSAPARMLLMHGEAAFPHVGGKRALSAADERILAHHRHLEAIVDDEWTIWDLLEQKPEVPVTMILSVAAVGVIWLVLLRLAARPIVYATLGVQIAFCVYLGSLVADGGSASTAAWFYIIAAVATLWCVLNPGKLKMASSLMCRSAQALASNPSLFLSCLVLYVPYILYVYLFLTFLTKVALNWEFAPHEELKWMDQGGKLVSQPTGNVYCRFQIAPWAIDAKNYLVFHFFFATQLLAQLRLCLVGGVVGTWYFSNTEGAPMLPTAFWLKTALTKSLGSLSIGALIGALCDYIRHKCTRWWWCFDPEAWLYKIVFLFFEGVIRALTRMNTVVHVFTGESFCKCKDKTLRLLRRNFVGAVATEFISRMVLFLGAFVFSVALAFSSWAWYEDQYAGGNLLGAGGDNAGEIWMWVAIILFGTLKPVITVLVISLWVGDAVKGTPNGYPVIIPLAALFIGSVCHLTFEYISGIVQDTTSTLLIATAIDNDNGTSSHQGDAALKATLEGMPCMYAGEGDTENPVSGGGSTALKKRSSKHVV